VLVPNKDLAMQLLLAADSLLPRCVAHGAGPETAEALERQRGGGEGGEHGVSASHGVSVAFLPGGCRSVTDFLPWREPMGDRGADLVVTTPAAFAPLALNIHNLPLLLPVRHLVLDEVDMLMDGGYRRPLLDVLTGFRRKAKSRFDDVPPTRHVFVGATIPASGLRSVDAFIERISPGAGRVEDELHVAEHAGLTDVDWRRVEAAGERLEQVREICEGGGKVMVFVNSVEAVDRVVKALR
jgi:superfamily II DNA/RNA helicase